VTLSEYVRPDVKLRHDELRAAGLCINGPRQGGGIHGPVISGGRCARCVCVHRGLPVTAETVARVAVEVRANRLHRELRMIARVNETTEQRTA
jgi:hypothetical protein